MPVHIPLQPGPTTHHLLLNTTFCGTIHPLSTPTAAVHQYRGIKYASIPARFRQATLFSSYPPITDATQHGPICPQKTVPKPIEEVIFGIPASEIPQQDLKQDEFECLNLNITCPGGLTPDSRLPVMLWVHGGGDRGSGSEWYYDGGALVRKSMSYGKPIILVTFNFRIGLLGFAANAVIREDNKAAGEQGTGNFGLRDQRLANEWVHRYISSFGGDPTNITLFGSGTGAADIVCHLLSQPNLLHPLFHRSILQSPIFEPPPLTDVASAGWALSRVTSALQLSNIEKMRKVDVDLLLGLGQTVRAVDDRVFFRDGWQSYLGPVLSGGGGGGGGHHVDHSRPVGRAHHGGVSSGFLHPTLQKSRNSSKSKSKSRSRSRSALRQPVRASPSSKPALHTPISISSIPEHTHTTHTTTHHISQPIIIGDTSGDSLLWSSPISLWTSAGVVRRLKAVCQSLTKTTAVLRAYDISSYTPHDEITERVLDLVNDARVAWPTHCIAQNALRERGGEGEGGVWRFVFDQEGPVRGVPHYAADVMYLFDNVPLPETVTAGGVGVGEDWCFGAGGDDDDDDLLSDGDGDGDRQKRERELDLEPCVSPGTAETPTEHEAVEEEEEEEEEQGGSERGRWRSRTRGDSFGSTLAAKCESIRVHQTRRASAPVLLRKAKAAGGVAGAGNKAGVGAKAGIVSAGTSSSSSSSFSRYPGIEYASTSTDLSISQEEEESEDLETELETEIEAHAEAEAEAEESEEDWLITPVDSYSYRRIRDTLQERWISFAHGEVPWRDDKIYVFGPEGEVGERSKAIFEGRRRRKLWREAFEPLGVALVQKLGVELSRGPAHGADR